MTMVTTQTIKILRFFWHSPNISLRVFRKAIMAADIAENPFSFRGSVPDPAGGEGLQRSPKILI